MNKVKVFKFGGASVKDATGVKIAIWLLLKFLQQIINRKPELHLI